jgi:F-type H+-transporting ATPase subunit beta
MAELTGVVTQVIGPVIDISFEKSGEELPDIHEALEIMKSKDDKLIV